MKEDDIRPDNLKEGQEKFIAEDIAFLLERKRAFIFSDCPVCSEGSHLFFTKNGFDYYLCHNCKMVFMNPRPTEKILSDFYATSMNYRYFNEYIYPQTKEQRRIELFVPRVDLVIRFCREYGIARDKILEVGAGYGIFCQEMAERKFFNEIIAIETTCPISEVAKIAGFRVYNGILEELEIAEKFNVVVLFEVIEHIANPLNYLKKVNTLMHDGGMLILTFPNFDGFDISFLGMESDSIDHEHLSYFNEKSIRILIERCCFEIVSIETPGRLDVELVRKKILSGRVTLPGFIRNICIDNYEKIGPVFQEFLMQNNLSSHMRIVARKINK